MTEPITHWVVLYTDDDVHDRHATAYHTEGEARVRYATEATDHVAAVNAGHAHSDEAPELVSVTLPCPQGQGWHADHVIGGAWGSKGLTVISAVRIDGADVYWHDCP